MIRSKRPTRSRRIVWAWGCIVGTGLITLLQGYGPAFGQTPPPAPELRLYVMDPDVHLATEFSNLPEGQAQDTIYIRFPRNGDKSFTLRGEWSDGLPADFILRKIQLDEKYKVVRKGVDSVSGQPYITLTIETPKVSAATQGGYRLESIRNGEDHARECWIFIDDVELNSISHSNSCKELRLIPFFNYSHDEIRQKFQYYRTNSKGHTTFCTNLSEQYFEEILWYDANDEEQTEVTGITPRIANPPPYESVEFTVRMMNIFGRRFEARTQRIEPMAVRVEPRIELVLPRDLGQEPLRFSPGGDKPQGECPFHTRLQVDAENATHLEWLIRNDRRAVRMGRPDTLFLHETEALREPVFPPYTLFSAGLYPFILKAWNAQTGCRDSITVEVQVDSSLLATNAIPNVFSPNDDGLNDIFNLIDPEQNARSLEAFSIHILDRNGVPVYKYQGLPRDWDGWNGMKNGKGSLLQEGVYYYIIRASGYDGKQYRGDEYKGMLYLFR